MGLGSTPGPRTVYTSTAQNHSKQQFLAALRIIYCTSLTQGEMGQHCLWQWLRIEKGMVALGIVCVFHFVCCGLLSFGCLQIIGFCLLYMVLVARCA